MAGAEEVPIYVPNHFDVLMGRGRGHVANPGNARLQFAVNMHKDRYNDPSISRVEKMQITLDIVNFIKNSGTNPGRFLRYDSIRGCWFEIDDETARLKVGNQLRYTRRRYSSVSSASSPASPSRASELQRAAHRDPISSTSNVAVSETSSTATRQPSTTAKIGQTKLEEAKTDSKQGSTGSSSRTRETEDLLSSSDQLFDSEN